MKYEKLLGYALHLFSKKSYTNFEIRKKCEQYFARRSKVDCSGDGGLIQNGVVDKVITRLIELKYLDDEQYAKDYINERIRFKPRGLFLIKMELKLKGIPKELIEKTITEAAIDEFKLAVSLLEKNRGRWQQCTVQRSQERFEARNGQQFDNLRKQKAKAANYLAGKGFKPDTVYKAIDHCYNARESRI